MTTTGVSQQRNEPTNNNPAICPFSNKVADCELIELRDRIKATRGSERETVTDRTPGVQLATTQALANYWATGYDWRKIESKLNALPQFIAEIDGLDIHFIHAGLTTLVQSLRTKNLTT